MNIFYPTMPAKRWSALLCMAGFGALAGGLYGAVHDQISFSISREYFTRMKFIQFAWADFGWPERLFAAEVGFLATWWMDCCRDGFWDGSDSEFCRKIAPGKVC